jgi:hypothetical protein
MKRAQRFSLFLCLSLFPLSAWACMYFRSDFSDWGLYNRADIIALVNFSGTEDGIDVEVIRSWKDRLPKRINLLIHGGSLCTYPIKEDGIYLLYLSRGEQGEFLVGGQGSGNLYESDQGFRKRIDWLEEFGVAPGRD